MTARKPLYYLTILTLTSAATVAAAADVEVFFSPRGGVAAAIASTIDEAKASVDIMSYSISESQICGSIVRAHQRGIPVRMIVTPSQEAPEQSKAPKLHSAGITIRTDRKHDLMHNKVVIADNIKVCTGSANHSKSADTRNAENMVIITDAEVARLFTENFELHWNHSKSYKIIRRRVRPTPLPERLPPLPPRRPRRKERLSWHSSPVPYTRTTQAAGSLAA